MEILKTIIEGIKNFITCVIGIIAMPIIVFWPIWLLVIIGFVFDRCSSDNSKQKPKTEHVITSSIVSNDNDLRFIQGLADESTFFFNYFINGIMNGVLSSTDFNIYDRELLLKRK